MSKSSAPARKISVSLPANIVDDLDMVSHLIGMSRSAFLSAMLSKSLPAVRESTFDVFKSLHASGEVDIGELGHREARRRYTSASKAVVDRFLESLDGELQHDLFNDPE